MRILATLTAAAATVTAWVLQRAAQELLNAAKLPGPR